MGFNPSNFPPIADAERLRTQADKFKTGADKVEDLATDSYTAWSKMPSVYEAPEASIVYGAFGPVKTSGQDLADDAATVKAAIDTYAGEAENIKTRYDALMVRYRDVEAQKASDDEWQEDEELVKEDNDILSDANALMADYMAAQRTCANKISGIYGGTTYVPTTQEGADPGEKQFGFTGEQLDAAAGEGKLPWGEPSEYDAPWWEDGLNMVGSFFKGVWSGVTGTATGLWNMVNFTDWETFSTTWKGIGTLAVDAAIVSNPALAMTVGAERRQQAGQRLLAVGKSAIHWDEWQEDPAYAAGASTFDLATILLTAGAGAVTKTGSVASKISTVAGAGSKAGTALKVTGLGAAARTTVKVSDLATDLKIKSLDLGTSVTQKLGNVAPGTPRVDAMPEPAPAHVGVDSPDSGPSTSAVDHGNTRMDTQADGRGSGPAASTTGPNSGSSAPATTGPQGGSPDGGSSSGGSTDGRSSDAGAPVAGGEGPADGGSSDGPESAPAGDTAEPGSGAPDGGDTGTPDRGDSDQGAPATDAPDGGDADSDADTASNGGDSDAGTETADGDVDAGDGAGTGSEATDVANSTDVTSHSESSGDDAGGAQDSGLSASERDRIVAMDKGTRPDPTTYLSPEYISEHLAPFEEGATRFMTESNLEKYGIAQRDGTSFVMPKPEVDALVESTGGNPRAMEEALGLPEGFFENGAVRVDIESPGESGLRMPSGNEAGANEQWVPGGQLPTGFSEAVVDGADIDPSEYDVSTLD
ncbi:hypothetical protein [Arthrobacter castelli]|uniref:hypothetical protein n=1 Tax=Arthrobacter castelli TaxID=271431 RepID=UPI0004157ABB|nr:hypothetical protein [Arthrobacter castelli]